MHCCFLLLHVFHIWCKSQRLCVVVGAFLLLMHLDRPLDATAVAPSSSCAFRSAYQMHHQMHHH